MARTLQKNIRVTPKQWKRVENAAEERDVSTNRLMVEFAMEALDRRELPRIEAKIRIARASLFAAQVLARDLIASGREQEIAEIHDFISTIVPDGHTGEPVRGRSDDHPDDTELIRGRMPAAGGNASGDETSTIPVGLAPLIERTFRYAYLLATLKRDERVDEGRGTEVEALVKAARELRDSVRGRASK